MGWNPESGFYISPFVLDAPWDSELEALNIQKYGDFIISQAKGRGLDDNYNFISLKSIDGESSTIKPRSDRGEFPEDYFWTDAYHNSPALKSVVDWFKTPKTKVRIFQQLPNGHIDYHHDWDNERLGFDTNNLTVRIWVNLDGENSMYRLSNGDVDISVQLKRGQFIILNTDTIFHETWNFSDTKPRNLLNITCRANSWIKNMHEVWNQPKIVKTMQNSTDIN